MTLSVNPGDLVRVLTESRRHRKDAIGHYLNEVVDESEKLALIWQEAFTQLAQGSFSLSKLTEDKRMFFLRTYAMKNGLPFSSLRFFYSDITLALGDRLDGNTKENILTHLAKLIMDRDITKAAYIKYVKSLRNASFLDVENDLSDFANLEKSVQAMQKEVASLKVLVARTKVLLG